MLKGIPSILTPELLKILMEMGHSDELLICDGNYPKLGCPERNVRLDGHGIPEILDAILKFFPLDSYVENPTSFMAVTPGDPYKPEIWPIYREIGEKNGEPLRDAGVSRFDFYEKGRKCYACISTSEGALYANVILKKGVIK